MILINDRGIGTTNPQTIIKNIKARSGELHEIIDDDNSPQERREKAYTTFTRYQEELQDLNALVKMPFDVLIVIEKEE